MLKHEKKKNRLPHLKGPLWSPTIWRWWSYFFLAQSVHGTLSSWKVGSVAEFSSLILFSRIYRTTTEKAMAPHSSTLAWKIPWTEETVRLQSMGSLRVGYNWATSLSLSTFVHWRRKWQPTPVFLPGESQGRGSLVGCCLWGHTESDTTEVT